jgi:hypothetical protein
MTFDVALPQGGKVQLGDMARQDAENVDIRGGRVVRLADFHAHKGEIEAFRATTLEVSGDASIGGDLDIAGGLSIDGSLAVGGGLSIDGSLAVGGGLAVGGSLEIANAAAISWLNAAGVATPTLQKYIDDNVYLDNYDGSIILRSGGGGALSGSVTVSTGGTVSMTGDLIVDGTTINCTNVDAVNFDGPACALVLGQAGTFSIKDPGGAIKQILRRRITGYTAMTGAGDKATAYDTAAVTLAQLAGRVKQLQDDLTTHGMIGA